MSDRTIGILGLGIFGSSVLAALAKQDMNIIAISSYNAAAYLHYCVESLVIGGEQVGILIINDGSQDQTQEIAECLASKYPNIVRAIYQENKGHGGVVNRGLAEASGRYFKVVDSDDWWILVPT